MSLYLLILFSVASLMAITCCLRTLILSRAEAMRRADVDFFALAAMARPIHSPRGVPRLPVAAPTAGLALDAAATRPFIPVARSPRASGGVATWRHLDDAAGPLSPDVVDVAPAKPGLCSPDYSARIEPIVVGLGSLAVLAVALSPLYQL